MFCKISLRVKLLKLRSCCYLSVKLLINWRTRRLADHYTANSVNLLCVTGSIESPFISPDFGNTTVVVVFFFFTLSISFSLNVPFFPPDCRFSSRSLMESQIYLFISLLLVAPISGGLRGQLIRAWLVPVHPAANQLALTARPRTGFTVD